PSSLAAGLWGDGDTYGLAPTNFSASCGDLTYTLSLLADRTLTRTCAVELLDAEDVVVLGRAAVTVNVPSPAAQTRAPGIAPTGT
ncbi:hypothetical protein OFC53_35145, partial [Escherichia coli]|nr:hypothetical protein [Escherichia coli]